MRAGALSLALTSLLICVCPAQAADLAKIERVIAREPKYQGKPTYCLLVFGPEAKFRVWLVRDGAVLYVDRNGDGDLTAPDKRVAAIYHKDDHFGFKPGSIHPPDGKTKYNLAQLHHEKDGCEMSIYFGKKDCARAGFDGPGPLLFAERPQDAPIIHFLGPLTLMRFEPQPGSVSPDCAPGPLVRGENCKLGFSLGTPGLGNGTFAKSVIAKRGSASAEVRFANGKTLTASLEPDD